MTEKLLPAKHRDLAIILLCLLGLVLAYHLGAAMKGHGRYRDQHLGTALHYAATQIDLRHTIIVGQNATETPTILELPVWQMAAGLAFKLFGTWWGWANVVSLLLCLNCLYPLFRISREFYGERAAWWSIILFMSQGLVFYYAGEAGTDGLCLCLSVWFWFACCRLLEEPGKWFLPAAALGALLAVSKMPFFMATGLAALFLLLQVRGFKLLGLAVLAGVGAVSAIIFLLWNHYCESLQQSAVLPYMDLRFSGSTGGMSTMSWYFGDWHYRLNPGNWIKSAWRLASSTFGSFSLIALFVFAFGSRRIHPAAKYLVAGAFVTTLIFTHLILHHWHYLMMYSPAIAMLCAAALVEIEKFFKTAGIASRLTTGTAAAIIFAALFQGLMTMRAFSFDVFPAATAAVIRAHTDPQDKLVIINGGWGGDQLIQAGRKGLSILDAGFFENPDHRSELKQLGFNKLVIVSDSPFQTAIQAVNPGQTGVRRGMAKDCVTPLLEKWPTVLATDDVIIKDIP